MSDSRREVLLRLYDTLAASFGPRYWWPADSPFEVCIGAILTQNAPWTGVVKSIRALKELGIFSPERIAGTNDRIIAEAVRPTIYFNQKARRLKTFCSWLMSEWNGSIENMRGLDLLEARGRLLSLSGIGFETADSILLYALDYPIFVVDAYTKRILLRHGMVGEEWEYETLREYFESVLEPDASVFKEYHALLCHLGAFFCKRKPECDFCPARHILGEPTR